MTQEIIPLQSDEEILPIWGYEGLYSITNFGRVWSHIRLNKYNRNLGNKFLKIQWNKKYGYYYIVLCKEGKTKIYKVHILEARAFIENPLNLPMVNHKDGDKQNNFAGTRDKNYENGNLEWCTKQDNENHASVLGLRTYKKHSKFYGVWYDKNFKQRKKPWRVGFKIQYRTTHVGSYKTEVEAAYAYNKYVIEHGLNRPLNKI